MRVLWLSDAGCHTGFGRVTQAIGDRLVTDYGHDVHCLAVNYMGDYWPTQMKLYRANKMNPMDMYGQARFIEMLGMVMPHVVVVVNDPHVVLKFLFQNSWDPDRILLQRVPIVAYMPIDGYNQPPNWEILANVTKRVAMTEFGQAYMPEAPIVYHGIDPDTFHPVSSSKPIVTSGGMRVTTKREAKRAFGYPDDCFLVLRVDRNSDRKNYADSWRALVPFMKRHKDVIAHFHCQASKETTGVELGQLFSRDAETREQFRVPEGVSSFMGWSESDLAVLYNAADVFLSTSWGEGFGLTLAEAAACGLPIIAQNVSAIPEVVGPGGILVEPQRPITVPSGEDQWLPDVVAFEDALERIYKSRAMRRDLGEQAVVHVNAMFSWDTATAQFDELIRQAESTRLVMTSEAKEL